PELGIFMDTVKLWIVPGACSADCRGPIVRSESGQSGDKARPVGSCPPGRWCTHKLRDRIGMRRDGIKYISCRCRSHARHQLQDAETCDPIARILSKAQNREQIFDMGGVEELEPSELDEGDIASGE